MSRLAAIACFAAVFISATRAKADPWHVTFRAVNRGIVTSIQVDAGFGVFECPAVSYEQHGRRFTVHGLGGQLECRAEDGTVVATSKQLEVQQSSGLIMRIGRDTATGLTGIWLYGGTRDPKIVQARVTPAVRNFHSN
jgi:hypothetical protein